MGMYDAPAPGGETRPGKGQAVECWGHLEAQQLYLGVLGVTG